MNSYIARVLGDGITPVSDEAVNALRLGYWKKYGATLLGLILHHKVSIKHFLTETHDLPLLSKMIRVERGLRMCLTELCGRKILLTNAPALYSHRVMRHLGVQRQFEHHIAIEHMHVHGKLRPKPSRLMLGRLLRKHKLSPDRCILVEDTLANLKSAKRLGMRTVWVTQYLRMSDPIGAAPLPRMLKRPRYVDVKVKSVRQLAGCLHKLR